MVVGLDGSCLRHCLGVLVVVGARDAHLHLNEALWVAACVGVDSVLVMLLLL